MLAGRVFVRFDFAPRSLAHPVAFLVLALGREFRVLRLLCLVRLDREGRIRPIAGSLTLRPLPFIVHDDLIEDFDPYGWC